MKLKLVAKVVFCCCFSVCSYAQSLQVITINTALKGRKYEGIGALSAGASSKLLQDYPENYRSQILDYLFKPKFGASLQQLKVEIGGDINSTDGTEPSHAHTREEFINPKPLYFNRGYEWMLLKEAQRRNPKMILDCLEWGTPGWVGNGLFYSAENADYIASFINGAQKYQGINFDYTGIWNERDYDTEWIKLLRKKLDANQLQSVKIVAADVFDWKIADDMTKDPELNKAVYAMGIHYNEKWEKNPYSSTAVTQALQKPIRLSEGGPWSGDWNAFAYFAKMNNRSYIEGKITNIITWSLITSYYDNLSIPGSGLMTAKTPWSGHYEVQPAVWAVAHTTQFAVPGWSYVDGGCGYLKKGSYVSLASPDGKDLSIIIETMDTTGTQQVSFRLGKGFSNKKLSVWKSTKNKVEFVQLPAITPQGNEFSITLDGQSLYSISTTTGQQKGISSSPNSQNTLFPMPYHDDFETTKTGSLPKYFMDQGGVFEVQQRTDNKGKCLRQMMPQHGIEWGKNSAIPLTILGDTTFKDYEVSVEVNMLNIGKSASVMGHLTEMYRGAQLPKGYVLRADAGNKWVLYAGAEKIASGQLSFKPNSWHVLKLKFTGDIVKAFIDGQELASIKNHEFPNGLAGIGCDFDQVEFDNFRLDK